MTMHRLQFDIPMICWHLPFSTCSFINILPCHVAGGEVMWRPSLIKSHMSIMMVRSSNAQRALKQVLQTLFRVEDLVAVLESVPHVQLLLPPMCQVTGLSLIVFGCQKVANFMRHLNIGLLRHPISYWYLLININRGTAGRVSLISIILLDKYNSHKSLYKFYLYYPKPCKKKTKKPVDLRVYCPIFYQYVQ